MFFWRRTQSLNFVQTRQEAPEPEIAQEPEVPLEPEVMQLLALQQEGVDQLLEISADIVMDSSAEIIHLISRYIFLIKCVNGWIKWVVLTKNFIVVSSILKKSMLFGVLRHLFRVIWRFC